MLVEEYFLDEYAGVRLEKFLEKEKFYVIFYSLIGKNPHIGVKSGLKFF